MGLRIAKPGQILIVCPIFIALHAILLYGCSKNVAKKKKATRAHLSTWDTSNCRREQLTYRVNKKKITEYCKKKTPLQTHERQLCLLARKYQNLLRSIEANKERVLPKKSFMGLVFKFIVLLHSQYKILWNRYKPRYSSGYGPPIGSRERAIRKIGFYSNLHESMAKHHQYLLCITRASVTKHKNKFFRQALSILNRFAKRAETPGLYPYFDKDSRLLFSKLQQILTRYSKARQTTNK